ncbi:MAG TPA: hypothetical protein EYH58_07685 [Aquifex aeolicus]|nr:hypothetical protein [Aquifex aeolicus]
MEKLRKINFKFLEYPFNVWGLETFDILLGFLAGFPFIILAFIINLFFFVLGILVMLTILVFIRKKKEGKAFNYTYRLFIRSVRKLLGKKKVVYV